MSPAVNDIHNTFSIDDDSDSDGIGAHDNVAVAVESVVMCMFGCLPVPSVNVRYRLFKPMSSF